jgi:hemerythrin-like domain-containing protein
MARRHESLISLSHDHHDALLLAWRLRTGDLSSREPELRASHVTAFFDYRLINHFKVEEELLFPAFREVLGVEASLIEVMLSDHQELSDIRKLGSDCRETLRRVDSCASECVQ